MRKTENNYAYIDGANLHKGIQNSGWNLDYRRFRVWLSEKYSVKKAYIFIGLVPKHKDVYTTLQETGFTLIFKETTFDEIGHVKGNCDTDLVLQAVRDFYEKKFDKAVLVSSDGDYASLVKFIRDKDKMLVILSPSNKCSILLKRTNVPIVYIDKKKPILEFRKEKAPDTDRTA